MSDPTVARLRWRADLLELDAEALKDTNIRRAGKKIRDAEELNEEADLLDDLLTAKATGTRAEKRQAANKLRRHRERVRAAAEEAGERRSGTPLDNFAEPTDAELIGA